MLRKCVVTFQVLAAFDENIKWQAKIAIYQQLAPIYSLSNHVHIVVYVFYLLYSFAPLVIVYYAFTTYILRKYIDCIS